MPAYLQQADRLLRPRELSLPTLQTLPLLVLILGGWYGTVMGSYGGFGGERLWQVLYSATKVPLLLLATFSISLPSFFVLNTLAGLRADFGRVFSALLATQAGMTLILAALSPYTALWYLSFESYTQAILFNGVMFGIASFAAQFILLKFYNPLIRENKLHRLMLVLWLVLYAFVGIQMGWVLRPFIGSPDEAIEFFRENSWGNAYERVFQIFLRSIGQ
ncbi:hypothetical protein Pla110_15910 [Polystyrenella longa]|uniref:Yip1 domain protein n=1 Tax=Polystyrenella longa TaxID=2528007 RepID=A0A518CKW8_9PLAN|nr:hypothetical protein [Polystyrenella longa]QDU79872.1 hypothetical protein Pla110_15910 [Polystyrenella longa]